MFCLIRFKFVLNISILLQTTHKEMSNKVSGFPKKTKKKPKMILKSVKCKTQKALKEGEFLADRWCHLI